jgi:predicted nucleic acid-binding protein
MEWVSRFTPHRVLREGHADRVVLDTSVIRYLVQGGAMKNVLDLAELARVKGDHPVSIADAAWAEIMSALLRPDGGIPFPVWGRKAAEIDAVLDPDLPIVPSGGEMVALSGLSSPHGFDRAALAAWFQAVWKHTARAKSAADLATPREYDGPDGSRHRIGPLDETRPQEEILKRGEGWRVYIERIAALREHLTPDDAAALMRANLGLTLPAAVLDRLDLLIRVVGAYSARAGNPEHPYAADTNDAMDMDILFSTVLPAVVVTADKRMRNAARASGSADGWRVMFPGELLEWLRAEPSTAQRPPGAKR